MSNLQSKEARRRARVQPDRAALDRSSVAKVAGEGATARFITAPLPRLRSLEGSILFARNGSVYGWSCDRSGQRQPVVVEAVVDDEVIATANADRALPLEDGVLRLDARGCGFVLNLFAGRLASFVRCNRTVSVDVRVAGTSLHLARQRLVFSPSAKMDRANFEGFVDGSDDGFVQGWVRSTANPDEEIDVAILLDNVFIGRARAYHYRADLVAHDIGHGEHGFRFKLPVLPKAEKACILDVMIAQNGLRLNHSPLTVKARKVLPRSRIVRWFE